MGSTSPRADMIELHLCESCPHTWSPHRYATRTAADWTGPIGSKRSVHRTCQVRERAAGRAGSSGLQFAAEGGLHCAPRAAVAGLRQLIGIEEYMGAFRQSVVPGKVGVIKLRAHRCAFFIPIDRGGLDSGCHGCFFISLFIFINSLKRLELLACWK